jgi:glycerol-3-phosphate dehydrogenase (NAD(P)+)
LTPNLVARLGDHLACVPEFGHESRAQMVLRVAVLGSGSWGSALAVHLARMGHSVALWGRSAEAVARLARRGEDGQVHPGVVLPENVQPTTDLAAACRGCGAVVFSCPSHAMRELAEKVRPLLDGEPLIVSTAKGIEQDTHATMSAVLGETLGAVHRRQVSVLSGPSFAREVAHGMPTAVTGAAADLEVAQRLQQLFSGPTFRVYTATDVVGVEIGGAVKNVIAVAAGVSDGLGFGHSTRAALITRGLAEIGRLAARLGAERQTLYGLSGLGDLVLTCTGDLSRNRQVGLRLGRGETLAAIVGSMTEVAEGVRNTGVIRALAASLGVEMPITAQMYAVLYEGHAAQDAVIELMTRRLKHEPE